jgi:hypothetical protein
VVSRNELNILQQGQASCTLAPLQIIIFSSRTVRWWEPPVRSAGEPDQLDWLILETRGWRNAAEMDGFLYCLCGAVRKQQNGKEIGN